MKQNGVQFRRIAIVGVGAIGGSLAALMKSQKIAEEIVGVDREMSHLEIALRLGIIDRSARDPAKGVWGADGVIFAVPLDEIFIAMQEAGPAIRPQAMITCTAATTVRIWKQIGAKVKAGNNFVPSFPLVFTRSQGPGAASESLLRGQKWLVASHELFSKEAICRVSDFWTSLGMETVITDSDEFETLVASCYLGPMFLSQIAKRIAKESGWIHGTTILSHWLELAVDGDLERTYQLYSTQMRTFLNMWTDEILRFQQRIGGGPAGEKIENQ